MGGFCYHFHEIQCIPASLRTQLNRVLFLGKNKVMNTLKSVFAVAVMALSATVSAQIVYVPDFPTKKAVPTQVANTTQAPASDTSTQETIKSNKVA